MKCVKKDKVIKRVSDDTAKKLVSEEGWEYCPKSEWKKLRPKTMDNKEEK